MKKKLKRRNMGFKMILNGNYKHPTYPKVLKYPSNWLDMLRTSSSTRIN
jgi:hypothetical protein